MKKRLACLLLALIFVIGTISFTIPAAAITDAEFVAPAISIPETIVIPDNDMLSDNTIYTLAEGSRYEIDVNALFIEEGRFNRPGTINYQKYIVVHNTGSYPISATAAGNSNYCRTTSADVSWHFTCGNDGIYQQIPVNEKGWHAGGNYWPSGLTTEQKIEKGWVSDASNSTSVGIETCVDGFPADSTASGEHWNSEEMYEWYENHFDYTATYLAMLVASLCVRMNFNPYTQIVQHYNTASKNCPMQMRYVFGTDASFQVMGTYYKVFLDRMYDYYEAFGGNYISTDTIKNTYYNPNAVVYSKGLYKATSDTVVYRAGNITTGAVGTVSVNDVVDVKVLGFDWGKITLNDGTQGWVQLDELTFVSNTYDYGTYRKADGTVVEVTAINGNTASFEGGTADISTLTRVYKVEVEGDTAFGSEAKYFASGETFTVSAVAPVAPLLFDIWETTNGVAQIDDKDAEMTTVTVLNSDIKLIATYRDKYYLSVEYGIGSGKYDVGDNIKVTARARVGYSFSHWSIESGSGAFVDATSFTTDFVIGEADTVISANYEISKDIDITGLTNYALNKSYTLSFKEKTGEEIAWRGSLKDLELTKLTNGVIATSSFVENSILYAGFMGSSGMFEAVINLAEVKEIQKVVLRDIADNGGSYGDIDSTSIEISVSNDGVEFTSVDNLEDTLYFSYKVVDGVVTQFTNIYTHSVDFTPTDAQYVKVRFKTSKYLTSISEIEVYGAYETFELGDVNKDGEINNLDAAIVLKYDAGILDDIANADVNGDGVVNNMDAAIILKYDAGIINQF